VWIDDFSCQAHRLGILTLLSHFILSSDRESKEFSATLNTFSGEEKLQKSTPLVAKKEKSQLKRPILGRERLNWFGLV